MGSYTIVSLKKRIDLSPEGQLREIYEIIFTTEKGAESFMRVPVEEYEPEEIKAKLEEESRALDSLYRG